MKIFYLHVSEPGVVGSDMVYRVCARSEKEALAQVAQHKEVAVIDKPTYFNLLEEGVRNGNADLIERAKAEAHVYIAEHPHTKFKLDDLIERFILKLKL